MPTSYSCHTAGGIEFAILLPRGMYTTVFLSFRDLTATRLISRYPDNAPCPLVHLAVLPPQYETTASLQPQTTTHQVPVPEMLMDGGEVLAQTQVKRLFMFRLQSSVTNSRDDAFGREDDQETTPYTIIGSVGQEYYRV